MSGPLDYRNPSTPRRRNWPGTIVVGIGATLAVLVVVATGLDVISNPGHGGSRAAARAAHCSNQLTALREAMRLYAAENRGAAPPDWARLIFTQDAVPEILVCPASDDVRSTATDEAALRADIAAGGHCSFIYVRPDVPLARVPAADVVAFELSADHDGRAHALLGDGRVVAIDAAATRELRRQFDHGVRPVRMIVVR